MGKSCKTCKYDNPCYCSAIGGRCMHPEYELWEQKQTIRSPQMPEKECTHEKCTERTAEFKNGCNRFRNIVDCGDRVEDGQEGEE